LKNRAILLLVAVGVLTLQIISVPVSAISWEFGLQKSDFRRISTGGFGDSANSYSWGMGYFKGDLYVGTNRHHLWSIGEGFKAMGLEIPIDIVEDPANPIGTPGWANEMRGEIWRYSDGVWELVHRSPIMETPRGWYPVSYGYRMMGTFEDYLYVCGIGTWWPPMPFSRVIRSASGDLGTWEDVTGILARTNNVRGLVEYKGKLYVSASIPGASPTGAGLGVVYRYNPATPGLWTPVSENGFGSDYNAEIPYLIVFNNHLYASTVNYATGFEVWKTDGTNPDGDGIYEWQQVVREGFGDTWNQWGMTMEVLNDYLYVGSAVGAGMVMKDSEIVGTRPFDVIRIDKDDNVELVVGAYTPSDPPAGWPTLRTPSSGWPAGFGNPLNFYVWHMEVHDGILYLGTFDACMFLQYIPDLIAGLLDGETLDSLSEELDLALSEADFQQMLQEYPELAQSMEELLKAYAQARETGDLTQLLSLLLQYFGGADLWKTADGINWLPVTLNGFDNQYNYGIRRLLSVCDLLYVGTANPFTGLPGGGCEVLEGGLRLESCDQTGARKDIFDTTETLYAKGKGYLPSTTYDIYVVNDVCIWSDCMPIPERVPGTATQVSSDALGEIPPTAVWKAPLIPGKYDIVIDVDGDGEYCRYIDALDNNDVKITAAFFVIPEYPLGTILGLFMCIAALRAFRWARLRH